jgi:23S rRNA pseudouridine1911/1915/1917 synthase
VNEDAPVTTELTVPAALAGMRIDRVLSFLGGVPRSHAAQLVKAGCVHVHGVAVLVRSAPVAAGDTIRVEGLAPPPDVVRPDPGVGFTVVYEDEELVVVDKPAGLVVHHGAGHRGGTLVDGLVARYPDLASWGDEPGADPGRPGIVHRLDKGTSGLLVVARNPEARAALVRQFRAHRAGRQYLALVRGIVDADTGTVEAPIGRSARDPTRMTVSPGGRDATTHYSVVKRFSPTGCTLVRASLETGRTHQVRVHLAAIGHPVVGDLRYGDRRAGASGSVPVLARGRHFLHAARLSVDHPRRGPMTWESPLPADLVAALRDVGEPEKGEDSGAP